MDFLRDRPAGVIRKEELFDILVSLSETGGCDRRTLQIVAQAVGVREYFDREVKRLAATGQGVAIERLALLLGEANQ